jgi:Protein of unknown function (DUF1194)
VLVHDGVDRVSLDDLFPTLPGVMTRTIRCFIVAFVLSLSGWNAHAQAKEPVDLLLALAADVSRSIDADKFKLQREGYAAAFSDPRVVNAIASGLHRRIAVCFIRPVPSRATKKERSGLQSACDELIDKGAIHHRRIVGCMRPELPELGEFIQ